MKFSSYCITKIDDATWHIADQINSYMYLLEGTHKSMLIDTGSGVLPLRPVIEKLTDKPVFVVNTHGHPDHVGANFEFDEVWISEKDAGNAAVAMSPYEEWSKGITDYASHVFNVSPKEIIVPSVRGNDAATNLHTFGKGKLFDLGNRQIEVIETPGHTHGCVCLLDQNRHQLFVGDTYCDTYGILMGLVLKEGKRIPDATLKVSILRDATEQLWKRKNEYSILFPAHHNWPLVPAILEEYIICADEIIASGTQAETEDMIRHQYRRAIINYRSI